MSAEVWNKIVAAYNKNHKRSEESVRSAWETLFLDFEYKGSEIDSQRPVKMGATTKLADIVIKNGSKDLFVVELKRHTSHENQGREQLFSYLNQLKMNLGILVCDKLYIYDYDYKAKEAAFSALEIPFVTDNLDGSRFVELFSKENFDEQKIKEFIKARSIKNSIEKELTQSLITDLLKAHFSEKYPLANAEKILSGFSFSITKRSTYHTTDTARTPTNLSGQGHSKDFTKYTMNGVNTGNKRNTVYAAVKLYVESNPHISFSELQQLFLNHKIKTVSKWEDVNDRTRFNPTPVTLLSSGEKVAVSNQWSLAKMQLFIDAIEAASKHEIVIKPIP